MPDGGFIIILVCGAFLAGVVVGARHDRRRGRGGDAATSGRGAHRPSDVMPPAAGADRQTALAHISHEMRTPLTAILGFAEALRAERMSEPEAQAAASAISRNGEHLLRLINDMLDFSKIEAGRLEITRAPCSPGDVIRDATEMVHGRAAMKGLSLTIDVNGAVPQQVVMDSTRVRQILANLLSNAVKYTAVGGVRLQITWLAATGDRGEDILQFDVIDSGVGMSEAESLSLFEPYFQGRSGATLKQGGTGLGLSISRMLAQLMGGDVVLISTRPDGGSHFRATIPIGRPSGETVFAPTGPAGGDDPGPPGPVFASLEGRRILVADDCPDNQRLLRFVLTKAGASVAVVSNGREAVEAALSVASAAAVFDAIVMDMQMPVMDGHAATRELRERGFDRGIIALTAHAARGDRERCMESGCDADLSKPFDRASLVNAVARSCERVACGARS